MVQDRDVARFQLDPLIKAVGGQPCPSAQPVRDPDRELKTPQQGASTSVFAATNPLLAEIGGIYLKDNDISPLDDT